MTDQKHWERVLESLRIRVGEESFEGWFRPLRLVGRQSDDLLVEVPNSFYQDWIRDRYGEDLRKALDEAGGEIKSVKFLVNPEMIRAAEEAAASKGKPGRKTTTHPDLNSRYTFENFVVGPSNQFAHAACRAVAEGAAKTYNPLFIYGGVGLGKTHLLNAVGNRIYQRNPRKRLICIQAETFMNDLINSIQQEKMGSFRKKYRKSCDVLLMDDIEILSGKERTQEEFFYTFNGLYESGKKIVLTSDRFPKDMPELEERLRSRFESGIIVDIQAPEFETKLAILRKKAEDDRIDIPDDVAVFLANNIKSNIRSLEGSLIRLGAFASVTGMELSVDLAKDVLKNLLDQEKKPISPDEIMKATAAYFQMKVSDLKSPRRFRKFAYPRQLAMYLCRDLVGLSYPEIGQSFGGKDHATVIHACKKVQQMIQNDIETGRHLSAIRRELGVEKE